MRSNAGFTYWMTPRAFASINASGHSRASQAGSARTASGRLDRLELARLVYHLERHERDAMGGKRLLHAHMDCAERGAVRVEGERHRQQVRGNADAALVRARDIGRAFERLTSRRIALYVQERDPVLARQGLRQHGVVVGRGDLVLY